MSAQHLGFYPIQLWQGWEEDTYLSSGVLPGAVPSLQAGMAHSLGPGMLLLLLLLQLLLSEWPPLLRTPELWPLYPRFSGTGG